MSGHAGDQPEDRKYSRRQYLVYQVLMSDPGKIDIFTAIEAVSSTAIEHPEWDLDEQMTWAEWMASEENDG